MPDSKEGESSPQPSVSHHTVNLEPAPLPNGQTSDNHSQPVAGPTLAQVSAQLINRTDLLDKARSFLLSPQVVHQDVPAKRTFLREKGLNETEIDSLLQNLPNPPPQIPPRTYPRPPPSNLPVVLLGLARLFTWLAGGSMVLLLLYRRFLFPRIAQTWLARHSLRSHQLMLMRQLNTSLASLKESQFESFAVLPHSESFSEPKLFSGCKSIAEIIKVSSDGEKEPEFSKLPMISLLRCGIKELGGKATTEELYRFLEGQIPWLLSEEGLEFEQQLWDTLSTCPLFNKVISSLSSDAAPESTAPATQWEYIPPAPVSHPPLLKSLDALSSALPKDVKSRKSPFQHALQSMSDFTGYLSTQVYLPYRSPTVTGIVPSGNGQSTLEEELRREIRALKGLVLNRRSFMPSIPRPGLTSPPTRTTA